MVRDWEQEQKEGYIRDARHMAHIANIHRNTKRRALPFEPIEFLPEHMKPEQEPADPEVVFRMLKAAFVAGRN